MKTTRLSSFLLSSCLALSVARAQVATPDGLTRTPVDGISTRCEGSVPVTDPTTLATTNAQTSYLEISSGQNFRNSSGQWEASQDLIEIQADGSAAALHGPHRVYWAANLNSSNAATIVTVSNRVFSTRILGLVYYDAASGLSAVVSPVQDTFAELQPPNQLLFQSAFASIKADVLCKYTKAGVESDVLLRQRPLPPTSYGLSNETTRLQIWHEWTAPSQPLVTQALLYPETNVALRATMTDPDLAGQILSFGDLWFPVACSYFWDSPTNWDTNVAADIRVHSPFADDSQLPSATQWYAVSNTCYLIESVPWTAIAPKLAALPAVVSTTTSTSPLPSRLMAGLHPPVPEPPRSPPRRTRLASLDYRAQGLLWPYAIVPSTGTTYEFTNSSTFYISGSTYFSGNVTLDANCYIKFATNAYLLSFGGFTFNGSSNSPSILTSKDENLYGQAISASTGNPFETASQAVWSYYRGSSISIAGVQIRYAQIGAELDENPGSVIHTVTNSTFQLSNKGVLADNCTVDVVGSTKCTLNYDLYNNGGATFSGSLTDICSGSVSGIPDLWFITYLGYIGTATANPSGDGLNNLLDYTLGLNPSYNSVAQVANRAVYLYTLAGWLTNATGTKTAGVTIDRQGNVTQSIQ